MAEEETKLRPPLPSYQDTLISSTPSLHPRDYAFRLAAIKSVVDAVTLSPQQQLGEIQHDIKQLEIAQETMQTTLGTATTNRRERSLVDADIEEKLCILTIRETKKRKREEQRQQQRQRALEQEQQDLQDVLAESERLAEKEEQRRADDEAKHAQEARERFIARLESKCRRQ
jgi:short-subunit dehydrogenase involved in D-alanine esterification of teichoic acids